MERRLDRVPRGSGGVRYVSARLPSSVLQLPGSLCRINPQHTQRCFVVLKHVSMEGRTSTSSQMNRYPLKLSLGPRE